MPDQLNRDCFDETHRWRDSEWQHRARPARPTSNWIARIAEQHAHGEAKEPAVRVWEAARERLRALPEDWDDEGAPAIPIRLIAQAGVFLLFQARAFRRLYAAPMPVPRISPTAEGGVDLLWRTAEFDLLVNFDPNEPVATFYGDDRGKGTKIQGTMVKGVATRGLLEWLAQE